MKIIFMGTPDFAVKSLEACIESHEVVAVFTQPDKPKGRGNKMSPPPVKVVAEKYNIPVMQPIKIRKDQWPEKIRSLECDVIVVVAYGQILSQEILEIPKFGCINVHASLLPKYRGAAPINWAIADGQKVTGVTTMQMDEGLDTGDMLLKTEVNIDEDMTAQTLHDILSVTGSQLLMDTLKSMTSGTLSPEKQLDSDSCYASMLSKEIAKIDWSMSSKAIRDRVRAFNPWPIAHTVLNDLPLKVYSASIAQFDAPTSFKAGSIVNIDKYGIYVKTGDGVIRIDELQWGSNKRMSAQAFSLGNSLSVGTILTDKI